MKKAIYLIALLALIGTNGFSQNDNNKAENILKQSSYHIDLPAYPKAALVVTTLLEETTLTDQEILSVLDEMVANPISVQQQVLTKYHGLPTLIDTGNPEADIENYNKAKTKWIKDNPEKHKKLISSNRSIK